MSTAPDSSLRTPDLSPVLLLLAALLPLSACSHALPRAAATPAVLLETGTGTFAPVADALPTHLRIVTYNVHYGEDVTRIARELTDNARLHQVDVLLLQEIRSYPGEGASRASRLADLLGLHHVYAPARQVERGGTHGVAILSRYPVADPQVIDLPPFKVGGTIEHRVALAVTLEVGGHRLRIYNVHLDTRLNLPDRLAQLGPVLAAAAGDEMALVGGDFNTVPFRWLRRTLPMGRARQAQGLDAFMHDRGYETPTAQFGSTMTTRLLRMRLDAIYLRGLSPGQTGVERDVRASDHLPLWLDVVL